jgi:hypothetical protein
MLSALLLTTLLPAQLNPVAPFPRVTTDATTFTEVAPGVEFGEYDLFTDAGPIVVHVLAVAPHTPDLRLDSVLADDQLTSPGETVSSMAQRTGAIAGINGDYFDIGNTNQPTNIVVHDGDLVRTPLKRYALIITADGLPQIVEDGFTGNVTIAGRAVELDAINVMPPPNDGTSLITPAFGPVPAEDNLTLIALAVAQGTPPFCTYRVESIADNTARSGAGYYLAVGLNAYGSAGVPNPGDAVTATGDLSPVRLATVVAAVGGGPLLLDGGEYVEDPDGPNGPDFDKLIPESGAAVAPDGTLFLIEVDGREPEHSVGVTRPEMAELMRAFGAMRGMALDGGGSSELVARMPAQTQASFQGEPSDGHERKIADGIFVYDDATPMPAAQIVAMPQAVHAMSGARVALQDAYADARGRVVALGDPIDYRVDPASLGRVEDGVFVAGTPGDGNIVLTGDSFMHTIPVEVAADPARVEILPPDPSAPTNGNVRLSARAFDAFGYPLALSDDLPWRALHGSIDTRGSLTVGTQDALVSLLLGDHLANAAVAVGYHDVPLDASNPHVMTVPRGGDASVSAGDGCAGCLELHYALGAQERAAYIVLESTLPPDSVDVAFTLQDDGKGALLKVALRNALNEEVLLPAAALDSAGRQNVVVHLPPALSQPTRLTAIYVIGRNAAASISGRVVISNLHAVAAGTRITRQ